MGLRILLNWSCLAPVSLGLGSPETGVGLARARAVHASADRDGDGRLTLAELRERQIAVTEAEFRDEDADRDGAWSRDEFTVQYRTLLTRSGERPAADLDAEVVRILALRRARAVDECRSRIGPAAARLARAADPARGATPEILELDRRIERAIADLEDRASGRGAVPADFDRVRGPWNERLTLVRALGDPASGPADVAPRVARALDSLQAKARAGSIPRADFAELRSAWDARPRRAVSEGKPVERAEPPSIEVRFERALAALEAKVFARSAARADWIAARALVTERARRFVQGADPALPAADDPRVTRLAVEWNDALDQLERRATEGSVARSDFAAFRARLEARGVTDAPAPAPGGDRR